MKGSKRDVRRVGGPARWALGAALATAMILSTVPIAQAKPLARPVEDWLTAQGSFCFPDGSGGCIDFFPPVANHLNWFTDDPVLAAASVDYAGLAYAALLEESGGAIDLGTTIDGNVRERTLKDGRIEVRVKVKVRNGLIFAINPDPLPPDFAADPMTFGYRPTELLAGIAPEGPALGRVDLLLVFWHAGEIGDPLPDLVQLAFFPEPGQELRRIDLRARATGALRAESGFAEGTRGSAKLKFVASVNEDTGFLEFSSGVVTLRPSG